MIGGLKKWLFALMGKPLPAGLEAPDKNSQQEVQLPQEPKEDSVTDDIQMLKGFLKKSISKAKVAAKPYAEKGAESVGVTTQTVKASVDNKFIKIVVRLFIIIFFVMILAFVALFLFNRLKEEGGSVDPAEVGVVTPTPVAFEPYIPSIYAEDPEILNLEEQINILDGEIRGIIIKETGINPPVLDWKIDFGN